MLTIIIYYTSSSPYDFSATFNDQRFSFLSAENFCLISSSLTFRGIPIFPQGLIHKKEIKKNCTSPK
ncbi:hypothetical protein HanRHA438_Chr03g0143621 [Helianthus annuus]|nr:hypothetical protein HanRHA438_Chr03g0143621 [Helianthus annuus]